MGWFGRKVRFLEVGRGWPGLGVPRRSGGARLGDEAEALPRVMALAEAGVEARGGVVVGEIFPSARHGGGQWGLRWMGQEGSLCLGLVTLETPSGPPPKMAIQGWGQG